MSAVCPNCGTHLGCSCQIRTSLSGIRCCTNCVGRLNEAYRKAKINGEDPYKKKNPINYNRRNVIF